MTIKNDHPGLFRAVEIAAFRAGIIFALILLTAEKNQKPNNGK